MTDDDVLAYVKSSAMVQGIPLTEQRAAAVAAHLKVAHGIARIVQTVELTPHDELAQIYCPAPFPIPQTGESPR